MTGRRRSLPGTLVCALLALAGVLGVGAATSMVPTPGSDSVGVIDAASGGHGWLRAPTRIHGLKTAELPLEVKDGDDDLAQPVSAASLPWLDRPFARNEPASLPFDEATSVRPLQSRPQHPRAPPILA